MKDFINLDDQELSIMPDSLISNIKSNIAIEDIEYGIGNYDGILEDCVSHDITATKPEEEQVCIKEDCDVSQYYGCPTPDGGFLKENLFSELTDEYQRSIARINLGISDKYAMIWGNINGNLYNQKDLYIFVTDSIALEIGRVIEDFNIELSKWIAEIEIRLKNKADIFSPSLAGTPTTTLPLMTDDSDRIASTEWVNAKIKAASIADNIRAVSVSPEYMCYGDDPVDVTIIWDYYKDVDIQSINDVNLDPSIREYTFVGVTSSKIITLQYTQGETTASRVITFNIKYPIYYGTSSNYIDNKQTTDTSFVINARIGEYFYAMIPNGSNVVLAVSSIIGGFKLLGTQEIFGNTYYVFKSTNSGLGETTIELLNQGDFNSGDLDTTTIRELLASKADKYSVYDKIEIDRMFEEFVAGEGGLQNYYTKKEVDLLIPDISTKADVADIPVKTTDLLNDSGFITELPNDIITEPKLAAKGFLTKELEPQFVASAAKTINISDISSWNNKVDKVSGMGLSQENYTQLEKIKLSGLSNYSDAAIKQTVSDLSVIVNSKANKSDIPDISGKADKSSIPTKTSQLSNDSGYLTILPGGLITEEILDSKGYLTSFTELDPTVPAWAKTTTKPIYTSVEVGADAVGTAALLLVDAKAYTDTNIQTLLSGASSSYNTFRKVQSNIESTNTKVNDIKTLLDSKADKSQLFSRKYSDLSGTPTIPSIVGLATEVYVNTKIAEIPSVDMTLYAKKVDIPNIDDKVDKIPGRDLSTNDYTDNDKQKLAGLVNYDDNRLVTRIQFAEQAIDTIQSIPNTIFSNIPIFDYSTIFESFYDALDFINALANASIITIEYVLDDYIIVYNKAMTDVTDNNSIRTVNITLIAHYNNTQDIKITCQAISGVDTFSITSELIPTIHNDLLSTRTDISLSAFQGKVLSDRLKVLEDMINTGSNILLE